jgi:hypothetical protein
MSSASAHAQHWYWLPLAPDVLAELRSSFRDLQPELDDHIFTVEVEHWVSASERKRRRKDAKVPASDQALMRMVWRACKRAGVQQLSPHQLRHGFANRFLRESDRDVVALQALMGHSRPHTTQQYTDDVDLDELAEALRRAADARYAQASPVLTTLERSVRDELEAVRWRRWVKHARTSAQQSPLAVGLLPTCDPLGVWYRDVEWVRLLATTPRRQSNVCDNESAIQSSNRCCCSRSAPGWVSLPPVRRERDR